jgi:hypothetical protein
MLLEAVALDDPVIFCEHKFLYRHLKAEKLPSEALPIGKARIAREGRDLTIVTYSAMVHEALEAATELAAEGWEIEVVDLRSVKPLDTDTVMASVARTGKLLASAKRGRGAASPPKSSRASRAKATVCSTRRRNGSTPRTRRCRIIRICGRRTARPRAPSPSPRENCYEHENSNHHAAAWRIHRRGQNRQLRRQARRQCRGRPGFDRSRDGQGHDDRRVAMQRKD